MHLLTALIKGRREKFPTSFVRRQIKFLLGRFKDKHRSVVPAVNGVLDVAVRWAVPLDDVADALPTCWSSSVAEVRAHTAAWLKRSVNNKDVQVSNNMLTVLADAGASLLGDSRPNVRSEGEGLLLALARRYVVATTTAVVRMLPCSPVCCITLHAASA